VRKANRTCLARGRGRSGRPLVRGYSCLRSGAPSRHQDASRCHFCRTNTIMPAVLHRHGNCGVTSKRSFTASARIHMLASVAGVSALRPLLPLIVSSGIRKVTRGAADLDCASPRFRSETTQCINAIGDCWVLFALSGKTGDNEPPICDQRKMMAIGGLPGFQPCKPPKSQMIIIIGIGIPISHKSKPRPMITSNDLVRG